MDADHAAAVVCAEAGGDHRAPVTPLSSVFLVAQGLGHEPIEHVGDLFGTGAGTAGMRGEPYPGRLGATTSKASTRSPPCAAGSVSGPRILLTSQNEPGKP